MGFGIFGIFGMFSMFGMFGMFGILVSMGCSQLVKNGFMGYIYYIQYNPV